MLKKIIQQKDNVPILIIHFILFFIVGIIYCFFNIESVEVAYFIISIFIILKLICFIYLSLRKKIIVKIANLTITVFLGFIDFLILTELVLFLMDHNNLNFNISDLIYLIIFIVPLIFIMPMLEAYLMKSTKPENILPIIIVAFCEVILGTILYFIDPKESAIISAFSALFIFLLTPENLEVLLNIKISKYRAQQISFIRSNLIFLIPIMYIIAKMIPISTCVNNPLDIVQQLIYRLFFLLVLWVITVFLIYLPNNRQSIQKYLGSPSNQVELNGNWNMIIKNKYTKKDIIVRQSLLNIDGRRLMYHKTIFYLNKKSEVLNDYEEKVGKIIKIDSEQIILELDNKGERKSLRNSKSYIKFIKIGSKEYNNFKQIYKKENAIFRNIKILDPITQKDIEVTKFISYTDKNYFIEANSKTSDEYKLENDMLVGLKSNEESLTYLDTYESDTFY